MSPIAETAISEDSRADRRLFLLGVGFVGTVLALGVTAQSMLVLGIGSLAFADHSLHPAIEALLRIAVNLLTIVLVGWLSAWWRVYDRSLRVFFGIGVCIALLAAMARSATQLLVGVYSTQDMSIAIGDALLTMPVIFVILIVSAALVVLSRRARSSERERQQAAIRAADALTALQHEELRVRREVADALHGTMQQRLVLAGAELDSVASAITEADGLAETGLELRVRKVRAELDELRERELRTLSAALYPEALDRGLVPAVRALTARIPASIPVRFIAEPSADPEFLTQTCRLLLVRVAEEGVSNALRHGSAERITLSLRQADSKCSMEIGHRGLRPSQRPQLSGLARLQRRIEDMGGGLTLDPEPHGATLRAWVPMPEQPTTAG